MTAVQSAPKSTVVSRMATILMATILMATILMAC